jgi:hypothetical protein
VLEVAVRAEELTRLSAQCRRAGDSGALNKRLKTELRTEARKLVPPIRAAITQIPSKGVPHARGRRPLRRILSGAVAVQVKTGKWATVRVFMNPNRMPSGMKSLPGYFEGTPGHLILRHPVFGNRDRWVAQFPRPYFSRGTSQALRDAQAGVQRVMDDVAAQLDH